MDVSWQIYLVEQRYFYTLILQIQNRLKIKKNNYYINNFFVLV